MKRRVLFMGGLLAMSAISLQAQQAQQALKGTIVDEQQRAVPYVAVRLLHPDSTYLQGTTTDSVGNYTLSNVQQGKYLLAVSYMGYKPQVVPVSVSEQEQTVPTIRLAPEAIALKEVEVKAQSFIRQKDHVLIIPDKQQTKYAHTGYDLLYNLMIPGIEVDRRKGAVSTLGGGVTLYINGRKVDYREVRALRPKDIEKVEYYEMPTGKYAGDVASINYITKEETRGGYVALDGTQTIGYTNGDYNAVVKLATEKTNYTLFAGHTMNNYKNGDQSLQENFAFDEPLTRDNLTEESKVKNNQQYAQLNIQNQGEKRVLMAQAAIVHSNQPDNWQRERVSYSRDYAGSNSYSRTDNQSLMPSLNLYGRFNMRENQRLEIRVNGTYTHNEYDRNYKEGDFLSYTNVNENMYTVMGDVNYGIQFKHNNSLTAQAVHYHQITSSDYAGDYHYWQHLWSGETLLFLTYDQRFGKKITLSGRIGLSALQYRLHGNDKIKRFSPRANFSFMYNVAKGQAFFTMLSLGNEHPDINTINSVDQTVDMFHIRRGNPYLDKTILYKIYAAYSIQVGNFNFIPMVEYSSDMNDIMPDYYIENNRLIESFRSDCDYNRVRTGVNATWKVNQNLRMNVKGVWSQNKLKGGIEDKQQNFYGSIDINYYWKDFALNLYGKTMKEALDENGVHVRQDGNYGLSLGWFYKNWMIEAGANNLFWNDNKTQRYMNSTVYDYNQTLFSRLNQQAGYVKVAYTFDFGKKTSRDQKNIDTNINSAILKAR